MDAIAKGFGLIVPMPRYSDSQLGKVVYIDEGGVVRSIGSVFDDSHFQKLLGVSSTPLDHVINEENHPSLTVAFTTGSMEIKPLSEEECSAYVSFLFRVDKRSFILDSLNRPVSTESRPSCGWLITRSTSVNRAGDAIILGPNLRKTWLNIQEDLVAKWVKDAPRKSTLWTSKGRKRLPKLLVVLEEWTCPSWTRISWGENDNGPAAVGLLTTNATNAPMWRFLAMPEETMTSFRVGNTQEIQSWVVSIAGVSLDPNPNLLKQRYLRIRTRVRRLISVSVTSQQTNLGRFRRAYLWIWRTFKRPLSLGNDFWKRTFGCCYVGIRTKFTHTFPRLTSKQVTRKLNELGAVLGYACQEIDL